jgi:hypothetical protein
MGAAIDGTGIDKVLRDAVDSGGVPYVAAIAANRDGVIYLLVLERAARPLGEDHRRPERRRGIPGLLHRPDAG